MIGKITAWIVIIIFCISFIYGAYWIAKKISYNIFYKNMVKQTIIEMVKKECLN